eukprot:scaffold4.g4820.t1
MEGAEGGTHKKFKTARRAGQVLQAMQALRTSATPATHIITRDGQGVGRPSADDLSFDRFDAAIEARVPRHWAELEAICPNRTYRPWHDFPPQERTSPVHVRVEETPPFRGLGRWHTLRLVTADAQGRRWRRGATHGSPACATTRGSAACRVAAPAPLPPPSTAACPARHCDTALLPCPFPTAVVHRVPATCAGYLDPFPDLQKALKDKGPEAHCYVGAKLTGTAQITIPDEERCATSAAGAARGGPLRSDSTAFQRAVAAAWGAGARANASAGAPPAPAPALLAPVLRADYYAYRDAGGLALHPCCAPAPWRLAAPDRRSAKRVLMWGDSTSNQWASAGECVPVHSGKADPTLEDMFHLDGKTMRYLNLDMAEHLWRQRRCSADRHRSPHVQGEPAARSRPTPNVIVATAVVFYSASAAAGAALGGPAVQAQLLDPAAWTGGAGAALLFLAPLLAFLGVSIFLADLAPGLQRLKKEFIEKIVPMLEDVPLWGLVVLAFGAGLGEEVLFRGAVQPFAVRLAAALLIPAAGYTRAAAAVPAVGVAATSVIFGLLHALTPTYFLWATAAGALFAWASTGAEEQDCPSGAAAGMVAVTVSAGEGEGHAMKLAVALLLSAALAAICTGDVHKWKRPDFCGDADCPRFKTEDSTDNYDIRTYQKTKWVTTWVNDSSRFEWAYSKGTSRLQKYFKSGNDKKESIELTTPTLAGLVLKKEERSGGNIETDSSYSFSYWIPEDFQAKLLCSWTSSIKKETEGLHKILQDDDKDFDDEMVFVAVYDPPQKLLKRHNEIHVPVGGSPRKAVPAT